MRSWLPRPKVVSAPGVSQDAAAQLQAQQTEQGLRHLIIFLAVQVIAIVIFACSLGGEKNSAVYVGVVLASLGLHALAIAVYMFYRRHGDAWGSRRLPSVFMGCILVVDVGLFALARPDVYSAIGESFGFEATCAHADIACLSAVAHTNLSAVQCWIIYFVLLVLPFRDAVVASMSCGMLYSMITLLATTGEASALPMGADVAMMGVVLLICLSVRKMMEVQAIKAAYNTVGKSDHPETSVSEKVRRCELEFANESLRHRLDALSALSVVTNGSEFQVDGEGIDVHLERSGDGADGDAPASPGSPRRKNASLQSAPAVLPSACRLPSSALLKDNGNCLPTSSRVWVENKGAFEMASSVRSGDRILCHDNLTGGMKYAAVVHSKTLGANDSSNNAVPWVTVTLENGESLDVTADHPLVVWNVDSDNSVEIEGGCKMSTNQHYQQGRHVRAGDLTIGQDALTVLKTVAIPVKRIEHKIKSATAVLPGQAQDGSPRRGRSETTDDSDGHRVALVVQQPERHSILVSFDGQGSKQNFTAVGSAGVSPQAANRIFVKNTFIAWDEDTKSDHRRVHSEPPMKGEADPASVESDTPKTPEPAVFPAWPPTPDHTISDMISDVTSTSHMSSVASIASSAGEPTIIRICGNQRPQDAQGSPEGESLDSPTRTAVTLSELQQLHEHGKPSMGSDHCTHEDCQPCAFHSKKQRKGTTARDCRNGAFCDFCHVDDHVQSRSAFRKLRRVGNMLGNLVSGRSPVSDVASDKNGAGKEASEKRTPDPNQITSKKKTPLGMAPEFNVQGVPICS